MIHRPIFWAVLLLTAANGLCAQGLDPSLLLKAPTDTWPTYNGDYSGRRYSTLDQINQGNVDQLTLAWSFQTHLNHLKDARTGHQIWHFTRPSEGDHIASRGVAMYKDRLYFGTPDAHLICLSAGSGKMLWDVTIADVKFGYYLSVPPLVVKDRLILGTSGDSADVPHFIEAIDPEDGKVHWRFNTTPEWGQPGSNTWPNQEALRHGGGPAWQTGTYDPDLDLVYWGTGNPHPVLAGVGRRGDNLFTCSILALHPETGKLAWYFQPSPHDTHDWDAVETPVLFDASFEGEQRKLLAQASRNGYFFLLDRTNGKPLLSVPYVPLDWSKGVDSQGRPIPDPSKEPQLDGSLVHSFFEGATNWMAPSFDPETNLFYVNAQIGYSMYYLLLDANNNPEGHQGGAAERFSSEFFLEAIDYQTGKVKWSIDEGHNSGIPGILTTAGHLLITADASGNLLAIAPSDGKILWHTFVGGEMNSSPMTYELDGRQYLITAVDSVVYAWALPKRASLSK